MKVTTSGLIRSTGLVAILAAALFILVQIIHPPETVEAVASDGWAIVHYITFAMLALFVVGVVGIYARQAEQVGWLGLAGFVVLMLGLLLNIAGAAIETWVEPLLATSLPSFVGAFNAMVMGTPYDTDLGAIPMMWQVGSLAFMAGTLLFGVASLRANVLSRWASGVFAFGLVVGLPVASVIGNVRLAAIPISIGLAWLGYSLWSEGRMPATDATLDPATPRPDPVAAG